MMTNHVCEEVATRELLGRVGDDRELGAPSRIKAWCGEIVDGGWYFMGADHVLLSVKFRGSIAPCHACLRAMRDIINKEIGEG